MPRPRARPSPLAHLRYLFALLARFKVTVLLAAVLFLGTPPLFVLLYRGPAGERVGFGAALHHVYFLLFGQPSLPYVDELAVEALNILIPPLGLALVVDGIVRFAYLYFAKRRDDKEWVAVVTQSFRRHVIVCGAGRVGYRVTAQLRALGSDVVVLEKDAQGPFVSALRDENVPVLIDNVSNPNALSRTNVEEAAAIVCVTNDDLANLNAALDARRLNPNIRVVVRMFDEELGERVRDNFRAEALSTSSLSAPAMALTALDPRIVHSFRVSDTLMVVSPFTVRSVLTGMKISELRDRFGALTLSLQRPGEASALHPKGETALRSGDTLTLQAGYADYLALRLFTGEAQPPLSAAAS